MKRLACLAVVIGCVACVAPATGPAVKSGTPGEPVSLFNGKNLDGWTWVGEGKVEDVWSVKPDGILHCRGNPGGYLRTTADYTSYRLTLKVRHLAKGNGGVLLRVTGPDKVWPRSIEAQGQRDALGDIWNIDQFPMKVDPKRTDGRHTTRLHPDVKEKPPGEWNDYDLLLDGGDLTLTVNGTVQNTATDCEVVAGKIALQSEGSEYEFKDVVLRPITVAP